MKTIRSRARARCSSSRDFSFRVLDGLITNLHVPRSTPVALTAAFAGLPLLEKAYSPPRSKHKYRFYSYGDAMLIL